MQIIVNFLVSVMLGAIYINSGQDATKVFDNYNLLFSVMMHHVMSSMMLPGERHARKRDCVTAQPIKNYVCGR